MRKIFSLIAAVLFAGSMMAQVTILPSDFTAVESSDYSITKSGVTVAVTASTVTSDQMRIFKNQSITISAESNITSIVFTCTANGTAKYGPGCFAAQEGYTFEAAGKTGTWTGSATSVTFTASTNQVRATQIVVTLEGGSTPTVAAPVIDGNESFEESVEVSISCATEGAAIYYTLDGVNPSENSLEYTAPFTITATTTVKAIAYVAADAVYSAVASKTFTKIEPAQAITCAAVYDMAKNDVVGLLNPVTVTFANGKNVWVKDETASMLIYFSANTTYAAGDVLSGIAGVVDIYNGIHEVKPSADQAAAIVATPGQAPDAEVVATVATTDVNKYIVMQEVEFDADTAFVEGTQKNIVMNDVTVRNQFKNGYAFEAGRKYDIYGVVTIYQNNPQVYFITAKRISGVDIENTNADAKVVKFFENGQLLINKNGVIYNAQGAIVK